MSAQARMLLCASSEQQDLLVAAGLDAASLKASHVVVHAHAHDARDALRAHPVVEEAVVFSSDEVEGINLAAALKADVPACRVYLAACEETGSVRSRLASAHLDGVLSLDDVVSRLRESARGDATDLKTLSDGNSGMGASGFLLTVVSGSGGAGKSTMAAILAHAGARRGLRCALVDADLQFGDMRDVASSASRVSLDELVAGTSELPAATAGAVVLVEAPDRPELAETLSESMGEVVQGMLVRFDLVVVNTGSGWNEQQVRLLERSAAVVFLVDQRASSVRACRRALDLCLRCGVATGSFALALNRCSRRAPFTSIDVSSALQGAHVVELADGGSEVEELLGSGMAPALFASGNALCASADRLLSELLPRGVAAGCATARESVIARFGLKGPRAREKRRSRRERGRGSRCEVQVPLGEGR